MQSQFSVVIIYVIVNSRGMIDKTMIMQLGEIFITLAGAKILTEQPGKEYNQVQTYISLSTGSAGILAFNTNIK